MVLLIRVHFHFEVNKPFVCGLFVIYASDTCRISKTKKKDKKKSIR